MSEYPPVPPVEKGAGKARPRVKNPNIRSLYVPDLDLPVWIDLVTIAKRDGQSVWQVLRDHARLEVEKRAPGNPQTPLERFHAQTHRHSWTHVDPGNRHSSLVCSQPGCGTTRDY